MLVDEHAEGDAIGVEAIEEILDVAAAEGVEAKLLLVLYDPLGHGGHHVVVAVADLDQQLQETGMEPTNGCNSAQELLFLICFSHARAMM